MRLHLLAVLMFASTALADIGPGRAPCNVPPECTGCRVSYLGGSDAGIECREAALAAGMTKSDCSDSSTREGTEYYCPTGKMATRGCGCGSAEGLFAFGALILLSRRKFLKS